MLSALVVLYLFLGGCGAAALLAVSVWSLVFYRTRSRTSQQTQAFGLVRQMLYRASLVTLVLAALCLFLDLGSPEKAYLLFIRPTRSLLSVGSFALLGCVAWAALMVVASAVDRAPESSRWRPVAEAVAVALALLVLFYVGLYLAWMEAVPLWHNAAMPFLLAFSSLSSGLSLVLIAVHFYPRWRLLGGWIGAGHRIHRWVIGLTLAVFALFAALAWGSPFARPGLESLLNVAGEGSWLIVGFLGTGLLVPLAMESPRVRQVAPSSVLGAETLCLIGGLILRFCLVSAASHCLG